MSRAGDPPIPAPLTGIRVIEIAAHLAGPFAAMQLADLGADVIKIESPTGGDPVRAVGPHIAGHSSPFARINRNKRSVALDLKAPQGKEILRELLRSSDVIVQNLRPGALARLGFDYESVRELNPRIIYVSASGWGQDGPLASRPGLDIMAQARSGLMSITGQPEGDPVKVGVPMCDLACGLYAAMATLAALRARDANGIGQHIDVSLFEAGVSFEVWEAGRYFATGEVAQPLGSAHQSTGPYQAFRTADGWVTLGAVSPKTWTALCEILGLTALRDDPRYQDAHQRQHHRDTLIPAIEKVTSQWPTDNLLAALDAADIPCAPIADTAQAFTDEHLAQRGFFWDAPHAVIGPVRQIGSPMRLSGTPPVRRHAGPPLGADTEAVLAAAGWPPETIRELAESGVVGCADLPAHD